MAKLSALLLFSLLLPAATPPGQHLRLIRDPFRPLVNAPKGGAPRVSAAPLPAGKAGVRWQTLQIQGIVLGGDRAAVALASDAGGVSFLLRPGDRLYDALIVRISLRGLWLEKLVPAGPHGKPRGGLMLLPMRP